jgi:hypothetical protein
LGRHREISEAPALSFEGASPSPLLGFSRKPNCSTHSEIQKEKRPNFLHLPRKCDLDRALTAEVNMSNDEIVIAPPPSRGATIDVDARLIAGF